MLQRISEVIGTNETVSIPAGSFSNVINMKESSGLEPGVTEINLQAPGVGQDVDNDTKMVSYGFVK